MSRIGRQPIPVPAGVNILRKPDLQALRLGADQVALLAADRADADCRDLGFRTRRRNAWR